MMEDCIKWGCFGLMVIAATRMHAAAPQWKVVPEKSVITFTAMQNNAPVSGKFNNFVGDIHFDPAKLDDSKVRIEVDMGSISTNYSVVADTLKLSDWFDVTDFPHAQFTSKKITHVSGQQYQVTGDLKVRDKIHPITVQITIEQPTAKEMHAKGSTSIHRTAFGVGQGEWASTNEVKDDVKVDADLVLKQ
jgi:polyisoprenoid-binding protein YceI